MPYASILHTVGMIGRRRSVFIIGEIEKGWVTKVKHPKSGEKSYSWDQTSHYPSNEKLDKIEKPNAQLGGSHYSLTNKRSRGPSGASYFFSGMGDTASTKAWKLWQDH
jgi:hypothetical protein